jgi:methylmalonyl-CoA carboxyltransferase large subunit
MGSPTVKSLAAELDELRAQIAALTGRLAELSKAAGAEAAPVAAAPAPAPAHLAPAPAAPAEISEEILIALAAAVAAYLGKRAPIRHVRLLGTTAWAQQGRVNIQASHGLNVQHSK